MLNPLASQPRLTRGHLRFRRSLYLGGAQGGLAALCAVWPNEAAPRRLTRLHSDAHARGGGVAPSPPSGHVQQGPLFVPSVRLIGEPLKAVLGKPNTKARTPLKRHRKQGASVTGGGAFNLGPWTLDLGPWHHLPNEITK